MKPILKYALIALLSVGIVGFGITSIAYAQGNGPYPPDALLDLLDLTREELHQQIQEGSTLYEIAENAGVDLDTFHQQIQEQQRQTLQERVQLALDNGDITREHANWILEGLEKGFLHGDGSFMGRNSFLGDNMNPEDGFRPLDGRPRRGRQN
jgi:hypothetical protein